MIHGACPSLGQPIPSENHRPRNSTGQKRISTNVFEGVFVDDVDDRSDDDFWILLDSLHQRLDPVAVHFDVTIEESQSITSSDHSSADTSSNKALPFAVDDQLDFLDLDQFHSNVWIARIDSYL